MKCGFSFLWLFILSISLIGQSNSLKPNLLIKEARNNYKQVDVDLFKLSADRNIVEIPKEIKEYSILSLDKRAVQSFSKSRSPFISMKIPQHGRNDITLELIEVNPFSEDFVLRTAPSMQIVSVNHGKHYRGIIKGQDRSIAAISVFDDQIVGMVSHPSATGNLVIGKLDNTDQHIMYQDDQISDKKITSCQTSDDMKGYSDEEIRHSSTGSRALTDCVRLYLEVDYDIYTNKGSSVISVNNYIGGLFNQVNTLYANEQINTVVSEILVWTQPSPYTSTTSDGMLNAFANQRQGFNGDLGMLLSYKASGGIAWVNGLCRSNPDFSLSYSGIHSTYQNVPTYSWSVEVCAHEFGHLLGSQHTHACVWNGNNTAIDGCNTPEGSCPNPGLPPAATGGTIMSYCHLTSVGIKFSNGFGTQPGNVIRNRVASATCLQACNGGGGGGTQCNDITLTLELRTDTYANETTWEIKNSAGVIVHAGGPYSAGNTLHNTTLCLPAGCYTFTIKDVYGDGICCAYGSGSYTIKQGTNTLITGGQFAASETKSFCTSGTTVSSLNLSTATGSAGAASGTASVGVTSNVAWTAASNATTWCTVTPASGNNNGTLTVNYTANTSTSTRTATVSVSGGGITRTYVLTQAGSTPTASLSLSSATGSAGAATGTASVGVTSNVAWTAASNATSWCTVTPASGSNNGTLTVNYTANTSTSTRTATVTVSGGGITRTYVLTQAGSTPTASLTLSASEGSAGAASGTASVGATSNVAWTAASNATSWCTVTPASGSNNGTLTVNYTANTSTSTRTATVTVSGGGITRTYVLTQAGSTPTASLTLSAATGNAGAATGTASVGVTSNVAWTAVSNATSWCTVTPASGSNNGTLTINYTANTSTSSRTATVTVSGGNITRAYVLTQAGVAAPTCSDGIQNGNETGVDCGGSCPACGSCTQIIVEIRTDQYPNEINWNIKNQGGTIVASAGNYSASHTLNTHPHCLPSGCYTLNLTDGYGDGILSPGYYKITQGQTTLVNNEVYGSSKTVNFCVGSITPTSNLTLSTDAGTVGTAAGTASVGVTSNVTWTAVSNATSWCTVTPASGSINGTLTVNYIANTSTSSRTATVTVSGGGITKTYVLTQTGSTPTASLSLSAATGSAGAAAGTASVGVTSNVAWTAATNAATWCTVSPASGSNNGTLSVNYTANSSTVSRSATVTVSGGNITRTYVLTQSGIAAPTCSDGIQNGNETGVDCGGSCPACGSCTQIIVEIRTDQYPNEINWNIKNQSGTIVASAGNYSASHTVHTHPHCLPSGCYTLNLTDGYGDGILSPGYYKITQGQTTVVNNEVYGSSKTVNFCVGTTSPASMLTLSTSAGTVGSVAGTTLVGVASNVSWSAVSNAVSWCTITPASGSNNGTLNVNYTANTSTSSRSATVTVSGGEITKTYILTQSGTVAVTCGDGIQNGNETGVDCGGSCPACPTCNDGIKNGNETGVDCGGSCAPCNSAGSVVLSGSYFEQGWDGWLDGGSDCFRYQGSFSAEGLYSIRLRDNSGIESAMTSPVYNLTPYSSVTIEFKFRAVGMESGEDFWLRYYNGTTWSTVGTFISGSSFENNQLYTINITLTGQFPSNAQFRFQCDASENDDEVFIDAVIIKGNTGSNLIEEIISIKSENNIVLTDVREGKMSIYPNPAESVVQISITDQPKSIRIFNMAGKLMQIPVDLYLNTIDVSSLESGMYIIQVETEDDAFSLKLIKI